MKNKLAPFVVVLAFVGIGTPTAHAQPSIAAVMNNYSFTLPGTPSYGIAQGSIFALFGGGLAPQGVLTQGFDPTLERNLGGVSVKVTVNGVTTEAVPYFVSPTQLAAILPSATPLGDGTITVTYSGRTSAPFPFRVVAGAFGFLTLSGNGLGGAALFDARSNYVGQTAAAAPGDTVVFWGTGRGGDSNDETRLITAARNTNTQELELYIGGKRARVDYAGRSGFPGLDQINAVIPGGVSGCFVAVYAKIGQYVSNFVTIPVAADGRVCSTAQAIPAEEVARLLARPEITAGYLHLGRFNIRTPAHTVLGIPIPEILVTQDSATANYLRYSPFNFSNFGGLTEPALETCAVNAFRADQPFNVPFIETLDAGNVTLVGPDGTRRMLDKYPGFNYAYSGSTEAGLPPPFLNAPGGTFRFEATGGPVVGSHEVPIEADNSFAWTNRTTLGLIDRSRDLELRWTGGMPDSYVFIQGFALTIENPSLVTTFVCTTDTRNGRFVVPKDVLSQLLPSPIVPSTTRESGQLILTNYRVKNLFSAPGLDVGQVSYFFAFYEGVGYR